MKGIKVYLVTDYSNSEFGFGDTKGVFSSRELAEQYIDERFASYQIEHVHVYEYILDEGE